MCNLERVTGFEPVSLAWKAKAQPLYHTRNFGGVDGINEHPHLGPTSAPLLSY
jgi:hypothetical protein